MKKQKIRPISILRCAWLSIWIFLVICSIGAMIYVFVEKEYNLIHCLGLIFSFIGLLLGNIIIILDMKKGIEFDDKSLKVAADVADKKGLLIRRFQYKTEVEYSKIEKIILVATNKNSLGQKVNNVFVQMPYIVFICKEGCEKAINVYYFSNRQKIKIINEVKRRAKAEGNNLEIESGEILWEKFYLDNK
ncbi:MAG: hypothetical protein K2L12_04765 [Clostridia bacterium]|nr:hypothetical protein [Clostridia bacterium]